MRLHASRCAPQKRPWWAADYSSNRRMSSAHFVWTRDTHKATTTTQAHWIDGETTADEMRGYRENRKAIIATVSHSVVFLLLSLVLLLNVYWRVFAQAPREPEPHYLGQCSSKEWSDGKRSAIILTQRIKITLRSSAESSRRINQVCIEHWREKDDSYNIIHYIESEWERIKARWNQTWAWSRTEITNINYVKQNISIIIILYSSI